MAVKADLRKFWWTLHRWVGVGLCVLLVPIAVSGALLVWKDQLDALIQPSRYAVTGPDVSQPVASYLASAAAALGTGATNVALRFPETSGWPVTVLARQPRGDGARPQILTV